MSLSVSLICQSFNIISSLKILQNFFSQNQSFPGKRLHYYSNTACEKYLGGISWGEYSQVFIKRLYEIYGL